MKKGYKKILIFEIIVFLILILNSFIENILNRYSIVLFVIGLIILFKILFGTEKIRQRYTKDIIMELMIVYLISFILYYTFGIFIGFYRNENYLTLYGLKEILLPFIFLIITKEYLRYMILVKSEGSKLLYVVTCILFIMLDLTNIIKLSSLTTKLRIFDFIALHLLPVISNNIVASYIAIKNNYKINMFWILISELYVYILPLIPNPGDYILSIIKMIFPLVILAKVKAFYDKETDEYLQREYNKKQILPLISISIFILVIVYFTSGHFHYQAIAIASSSMEPKISKGDVVIIEKIDGQYEKVKEGQVVAYKHEGVIVVHRIVKIIKDKDTRYFYSKGDANKDMDRYAIYENEIIGIVNVKIPFIGYPTVWLNEI